MIKGCIFDLDGVIVDTAKYHYIAWKELADSLSINFTEDDNERLKGVSRMDSLNIILEIGNKENFTLEEKEKLAESKNKKYLACIEKLDKTEILPGVETFIHLLKQHNIKIALGSVSKSGTNILKKVGLFDLFDAVVDGNIISTPKPFPDNFLKGAELLKIKSEECCVFEDAAAGIEAALRASMKCIGIGDKKILKNADKVIETFEGIGIEILDFKKTIDE